MKKNSRGFTLVEVIASIAILGIVVVSLLPFFPQILGWSKTTEDELVTGNLLSEVVHQLKNDKTLGTLDIDDFKIDESDYTYEVNDMVYIPTVTLAQKTDKERELGLFLAHIKISGKETYVYLKNEVRSND